MGGEDGSVPCADVLPCCEATTSSSRCARGASGGSVRTAAFDVVADMSPDVLSRRMGERSFGRPRDGTRCAFVGGQAQRRLSGYVVRAQPPVSPCRELQRRAGDCGAREYRPRLPSEDPVGFEPEHCVAVCRVPAAWRGMEGGEGLRVACGDFVVCRAIGDRVIPLER